VNWQTVLPDYVPTPLLILSAADPVVVSELLRSIHTSRLEVILWLR
jgi:hypothetical protein